MSAIRTQTDLERANIQVPWAFAWAMTPEQFDELCLVTVAQMRRDLATDPYEVVHG